MRYALAFRQATNATFSELVREGMAMKKSQGLSWAQIAMAANAPMMTRATMVEGRADIGILPTGQVVGVIDELPTVAALIERIAREAAETLKMLDHAKGRAA
jgi:NAD(P)H-dependent flavin oxidoreductase YrpB (nitropropane dioxygenase family)